jgi:hypothetical protein
MFIILYKIKRNIKTLFFNVELVLPNNTNSSKGTFVLLEFEPIKLFTPIVLLMHCICKNFRDFEIFYIN